MNEREQLYLWVSVEEEYADNKFDDQRNGHDESLSHYGVGNFWTRQIVQYLDRAEMFLFAAKSESEDMEAKRFLEMKAQQAMAKCMMTAKGLVESSIRVYGDLPTPGVPSGEIKEWT